MVQGYSLARSLEEDLRPVKNYLLLGRTGDICSILPTLKHEANKGERPRLVVSREYASVLEGVSYVEPLVVQHPVTDLEGAWQYARATCGDITSLQVIGSDTAVQQRTYIPSGERTARMTSFVKEMWRCGGWRDQWDDQAPLVFDQRSPEREAKLVEEHMPKPKGRWEKKIVLVATDGISSPFPYSDLLYGILNLGLSKQYQVVRLPRAERFFDLLALYERAWCLICTDSAPLHLAGACPKLPVLAIANDKPMLWNGSPWRPNHVWYCRYSDFPNRACELVSVVEGLKIGWPEFSIQKGMCGRYFDGYPYLKDCIRMALQRVTYETLVLTKGEFHIEPSSGGPGYSHRIKDDLFQPVTDFFCGVKPFWNTIISELPDLVMGKDYYWRHALWAAFRKHGAVDVT